VRDSFFSVCKSAWSLGACLLLLAMPGASFATVITATPQNFTVAEGTTFDGVDNGPVAIFADDNPSATAADFTATIDWGDGSASTAGTIVVNDTQFSVLGTHTYADEGSFTVTVTISDVAPGTGTATLTDTATVTEADVLSGTPRTFNALPGTSFTTTVATFSDTFTGNPASDFIATIDWGDATTSAGTVSGGSGTFQVNGTHTYAAAGNFSVTVTLSDDAPGTATATVTSTAIVSDNVMTTANNISATEHTAFNGTVAMFTDSDTSKTPVSFTTSINWGDGTTSAGTITGSNGSFTVTGQHTYADEGSFPLSVTVTEVAPGTATGTGTATATVAEADVLSGTPVVFSATAGSAFNGTVANFTDTDTANTASDFIATINWGDGTTTPGTISGSTGAFQISGTHTYVGSGTFSVTVTMSDDAPGTATATVTSTANVTSTLAVTAQSISVTEHAVFNGTVATFTDSDVTKTAASFTTSINWGDGTTTPGTVSGSNGSFTVTGQHTYADEGSFALSVTATEVTPGTATGTATGAATVAEADVLTGTPVVFSATASSSFNGTVANFADADTVSTAGDFLATINWGDGTTTAGTVSGGAGAFLISGAHTYTSSGTFSVVVTMSDDAPGTATATVTSTANVAPAAPAVPAPLLDRYGLGLLAFLLGAAGLSLVRDGKRYRG